MQKWAFKKVTNSKSKKSQDKKKKMKYTLAFHAEGKKLIIGEKWSYRGWQRSFDFKEFDAKVQDILDKEGHYLDLEGDDRLDLVINADSDGHVDLKKVQRRGKSSKQGGRKLWQMMGAWKMTFE